MIYSSSSYSVEVQMLRGSDGKRPGEFLLHYEIQGCPELPHKPFGWRHRVSENLMEVGCNVHHQEVWNLTCNGTEWVGMDRNCSPPAVPVKKSSIWRIAIGNLSLPTGFWIAIIIGVAIVVSVSILVTGMVCLKKQKHKATAKKAQIAGYLLAQQEKEMWARPTSLKRNTRALPATPKPIPQSENDYACVEDFPPHPNECSKKRCSRGSAGSLRHVATPSGEKREYHFEFSDAGYNTGPSSEHGGNENGHSYFTLDPKLVVDPMGSVRPCSGIHTQVQNISRF